MLVKVSGVIEDLGQTQQITDKMRKRDIVVKTTGQYPDYIKCEAVNDRPVLKPCCFLKSYYIPQSLHYTCYQQLLP